MRHPENQLDESGRAEGVIVEDFGDLFHRPGTRFSGGDFGTPTGDQTIAASQGNADAHAWRKGLDQLCRNAIVIGSMRGFRKNHSSDDDTVVCLDFPGGRVAFEQFPLGTPRVAAGGGVGGVAIVERQGGFAAVMSNVEGMVGGCAMVGSPL